MNAPAGCTKTRDAGGEVADGEANARNWSEKSKQDHYTSKDGENSQRPLQSRTARCYEAVRTLRNRT